MGPAVRSFPAAGRAGTAVKREPVRLDWTDGNDIRLLQNGGDFFPSLCAAIDAATVSVHLETYIFMLDRSGEMVLQCLAEAALRGVKVRVVLDGFGSAATADEVRVRLTNAGAQCRIFRPEPRWFAKLIPSRSRLRRLHRKVSVIDGQIAYVGGINIVDDYDDLDPTDGLTAPRFDFAVRVRGPVVTDAAYAQDLLWVRLNWARLRRHPRDWNRMRLTKPHHVAVAPCGQMRAALVLRDNLRFRQTFERAYLLGITEARRDILIANAYFFPGVQFRRALARAAARGVRVRLLLQGKVEYRMQYHATRSLYDQLLRDGIEIYEYMPGYLHAKVAVIDNVATVGSSNLDPFSLLLAREANVVIDDQPFAWDLQERLETAIREGGRFIRPLDYQRRGLLRRWVDAASYVLLRIGVALTGTSDKY
nr:cardiolipin synthase ClsB [Achromobacter sp. Marseille-Q0513]